MLNTITELDKSLFFWMNGLSGNPLFDGFNILLSNRFVWAGILITLAGFCISRRGVFGRRLVIFCVLSISLSDLTTFWVLKQSIKRERPCRAYKELVYAPTGCASKFGFPSNHASNSAAIATSVLLAGSRVTGLYFAGAAFLVGLSRIFLGVHYPLDILMGFLTGALYSYVVFRLCLLVFKSPAFKREV